jgi:hypothetical protein
VDGERRFTTKLEAPGCATSTDCQGEEDDEDSRYMILREEKGHL